LAAMRGVDRRACLVASVAAVALVAAPGTSSRTDARQAASCTYEQKQARVPALATYRGKMAAARRAHFRKHKSAKLRAAFVKAQRKKLQSLRIAAACTVPPLPPSSNASCSPKLAPYPGPLLPSEGPIDPRGFQSSTGRVDAVVLFLDYPDSPGGVSPAPIAQLFTLDAGWFDEVSNSRFSVSVTPVERWIRMPAPTASYMPIYSNYIRCVRDALEAADPSVDFSRYNHVTLANSRGFLTGNPAISLPLAGLPEGIQVDGRAMKFGNVFSGDIHEQPGLPNKWTHELLHTLGLPDLGGRAVGWDPLAVGNDPPGLTHLLGWHKWLIRWIDPPQLTCLTAPGTIEETLTPIAVRGGKKLVVMPVSDSYAYAVEGRRRIGYDRNICEEGVLVYSIDSTRASYEDPIVLRGPPRCGNVTPSAFKSGDIVEDQYVKVEVLATDGRNYRVRVTKK
jgi:M6 family metalloprotease-like protein